MELSPDHRLKAVLWELNESHCDALSNESAGVLGHLYNECSRVFPTLSFESVISYVCINSQSISFQSMIWAKFHFSLREKTVLFQNTILGVRIRSPLKFESKKSYKLQRNVQTRVCGLKSVERAQTKVYATLCS